MDKLTSSQKKELRGMAQRIDPSVHIGKNGLTKEVLKTIDEVLSKHELIKIRFQCESEQMEKYIEKIQMETNCECVGSVGRTASFYRCTEKD